MTILDRTFFAGVYKQTNRPSNFLRRIFFPNIEKSDEKFFEMDFKKNKKKAAPFISPVNGGVIKTKDGFETDRFEIPAMGLTYELNAEDEAFKRAAGEKNYQKKYINKTLGYVKEHDNAIRRKEALMTMELLTTGNITVQEYNPAGETGKTWNIDFKMDNKMVSALPWSNPKSAPLADLKAFKDIITKKSNTSAKICVMSSDVAAALLSHENIRKALDTTRIHLGTINPIELEPGVTYLGRLTALGIDLYEYSEWIDDGSEGGEKQIMPAGSLILGPGSDNWMIGPIAIYPGHNATSLGEPEIYIEERVTHQWAIEGKKIKMESMARALPKVNDIGAYCFANVMPVIDLDKMTVAELDNLGAKLGLSLTGNKDEKVATLRAYLNSEPVPSTPAPELIETTTPEETTEGETGEV